MPSSQGKEDVSKASGFCSYCYEARGMEKVPHDSWDQSQQTELFEAIVGEVGLVKSGQQMFPHKKFTYISFSTIHLHSSYNNSGLYCNYHYTLLVSISPNPSPKSKLNQLGLKVAINFTLIFTLSSSFFFFLD